MDDKKHHMLSKALDILEYIAACPDGVTAAGIGTALGIAKSSAFVLLSTLDSRGYVQKGPDGRYTIGLRAFETGARFLDNNDFYRYTGQVLADLVAAVDETAHCAVLDGAMVVYLSKWECNQAVRMVSSIGKRVPAHATAIGKALLCGKTDEEVRALYAGQPLLQLTPHTLSSLDELLRQLHEVRATGFAHEREESTPGVECLAVPVRDRAGRVKAGISLSIPLQRIGEKDPAFLQQQLLKAQNQLQLLL